MWRSGETSTAGGAAVEVVNGEDGEVVDEVEETSDEVVFFGGSGDAGLGSTVVLVEDVEVLFVGSSDASGIGLVSGAGLVVLGVLGDISPGAGDEATVKYLKLLVVNWLFINKKKFLVEAVNNILFDNLKQHDRFK